MLVNPSRFSRVLLFSVLLALVVIVLGAYTRLSDAGLGCPDWPGCYGHLTVPEEVTGDTYDRPLEIGKAWKEMVHRYVAGTLGIMVLVIVFLVIRKSPVVKQSLILPLVLLATIIFQALLGMWTVTLLLSPLVVTAHLVGGFTTLSLLWWLLLNQQQKEGVRLQIKGLPLLKLASIFALILIIVQILLGGWTSTNYAALACGTEFPTCAASWWPSMDFKNGFDISHKPDVNYEFGVLDSPARTAIHFTHRIGALIVFSYLFVYSVALLRSIQMRSLGIILLSTLFLQVTLGALNVVMALPLSVAVLHNLVASILLLIILAVNHYVFVRT